MPKEIIVPRLGWTMEEGTFAGWLKQEGDLVRSGEPLFTLDGDKALQEVEATDTGILRIPPDAPKPGTTVRVGALLGYLVEAGTEWSPPRDNLGRPLEPVAASPVLSPPAAQTLPPNLGKEMTRELSPPPASASHRRAITPRALRAAALLGIDWAKIKGTGRGGRIRERDVLAAKAASGGHAES